jgi:hypothetical protein
LKEILSREKLLAQIEKEVEHMDTDLLARLYAFISGMESGRADNPAEVEK